MTKLKKNSLQTQNPWLRFRLSNALVQLSESCSPRVAPVPCNSVKLLVSSNNVTGGLEEKSWWKMELKKSSHPGEQSPYIIIHSSTYSVDGGGIETLVI